MSKIIPGWKATAREAGKALALMALMLWLSGAFIYKVRVDAPAVTEKAPLQRRRARSSRCGSSR